MIMSERARELAEKLQAFSSDVAAFVENCSDEDWGKTCSGEGWPVVVVARHLGLGHFGVLGLAKMLVAGEPLPELTGAMVDQMNAQHAEEHADCTKDEVLGFLRAKGPEFAGYVAGLSDEDLDRAAYLALLGRDVSTERLIELVILNSGKEHLENMKAAVA
jgi:hypothetical protein